MLFSHSLVAIVYSVVTRKALYNIPEAKEKSKG